MPLSVKVSGQLHVNPVGSHSSVNCIYMHIIYHLPFVSLLQYIQPLPLPLSLTLYSYPFLAHLILLPHVVCILCILFLPWLLITSVLYFSRHFLLILLSQPALIYFVCVTVILLFLTAICIVVTVFPTQILVP